MQNNLNVAKDKVENLATSDPFKLSKYTGNSNNSQERKDTQRNIYILIVMIPVLLIVAFVFYMIASIDGAMFGTPDDEIDSIISDKMKQIIQVAQKDDGDTGSHIGDTFEKI